MPLFHLDLYRLNSANEVLGAGLEEYLTNPDGVTVVEWVERWQDESRMINDERTPIARFARIETLSETERRITYENPGA